MIHTNVSQRFLTWMQDFFVHGDVKTTALALAITSSLCCSIVWLVVNIISGHGKGSKKSDSAYQQESNAHISMMNFHLKKSSLVLRKRRSIKRQMSAPAVIDDCEVLCIRCDRNYSSKGCRYILCTRCCSHSPITCVYHQRFKLKTQTSVDEIQDKPTEIDLSRLDLTLCPERLGYIGACLVTLNLSCNKLVGLPEEIGFLRGLEELYLHQNSIKHLPESIGTLCKLKDLSLKRNFLSTLPNSIGFLEELRFLDLQDNFLLSLPSSLGKLVQLEVLILQNNDLELLPKETCNLINMKILSIADNNLRDLPEEIGNLARLKDFNVSNNRLTQLPVSICDCRALVRLLASNNSITTLPGMIGRLHQLNELRLNDNQLHYLPASIQCLSFCVMNVKINPFIMGSDKERIEDLNFTPSCCVPDLLELAARSVVMKTNDWKKETLPSNLKDLLVSQKKCYSCKGIFFQHYRSQISFHTLLTAGQEIPFYQQICSPNSSSQCQLLTVN